MEIEGNEDEDEESFENKDNYVSIMIRNGSKLIHYIKLCKKN